MKITVLFSKTGHVLLLVLVIIFFHFLFHIPFNSASNAAGCGIFPGVVRLTIIPEGSWPLFGPAWVGLM